MTNKNLLEFSNIINSKDPINRYLEYATIKREMYRNRLLIEEIENEKFVNNDDNILSNDIKVLLMLHEYYYYTCFFPNQEDRGFYLINGIKYEKLKWNIHWEEIKKEIINLNKDEEVDKMAEVLNKIFLLLLNYFSIQIFSELIDLYKVINRQTNSIISLKSMSRQVILAEKRINERKKNNSNKQINEFEQIIIDQNELYNKMKKENITNFEKTKTVLNKLISDDIEKYFLYQIILHLSKGSQSNYKSIYPLIRQLLPNRTKYDKSSEKYWFKNEKDFNNNSHLNQASYLKWDEYCTTKIKNFIKHV